MHISSLMLAAAMGAVALSGTAMAQPGWRWRDSGGWGHAGPYQRHYDPTKVATVTGKVTQIEEVTPKAGMAPGVHLLLETAEGVLDVHLGPSWYVERLDTQIEVGHQITVTGSRITLEKLPVLIAARITRGEDELVLRDAQGIPAWAGWRGRGRRGL